MEGREGEGEGEGETKSNYLMRVLSLLVQIRGVPVQGVLINF